MRLQDECIPGPYSLISVTACSDKVSWEVVPQPSPKRMLLHVTIPLMCQIRDQHGCMHEGIASVNTDVCLLLCVPAYHAGQSTMVFQPNVRLLCLPSASCDLCFDVQLDVRVEAYMIRWEPCLPGHSQPNCVELPLYPELHHDE